MNGINVNHITKDYKVYKQRAGIKGMVKSMFWPDVSYKRAVDDLSFHIEPGESVGFIGENGAGKSTTIKMLSGVLVPTSGEITVNGVIPYKKRLVNARNIGVVFGQRTRLNWDLPMEDSFELYKEIYKIDEKEYKKNRDAFIELLNMGEYYATPIRQLSLGQRMKVEIAVSMLHNPSVLYLDEPTIGLDVLAKRQIRDFIKEKNKTEGTTIILTSHDMKDLDQICERIIIMSKGKKIFDGAIDQFKSEYAKEIVIKCVYLRKFDKNVEGIRGVACEEKENHGLIVRYDPLIVNMGEVINYINNLYEIQDIKIEAPDIEDMVRTVYEMNKA